MANVSIRDLRNRGGEVVDRVARGERVTITRSGRAVAELLPTRRAPTSVAALIESRRSIPAVDPGGLRHDLDELIDPSL